MASQQKNNSLGLVSTLWNNWVQLDPARRTQVAAQLGSLGHLLTIAANVQNFAQHGDVSDEKNPSSAKTKSQVDDESDIIEAEYEEVKK
jgi:hypothetical protein